MTLGFLQALEYNKVLASEIRELEAEVENGGVAANSNAADFKDSDQRSESKFSEPKLHDSKHQQAESKASQALPVSEEKQAESK